MKTIIRICAALVLLAAVLIFVGFFRMAQNPDIDKDPLTQTEPERLAHRDAYFAKCMDGSKAKPDEIYCSRVADKTISYFTNMGFIQEVFHHGTFGIVPRAYNEPRELEKMEARVEASSYARRQGAGGSTRFDGTKLEEYQSALDGLYEDSDVFMSKKQRCDPEGEWMQAVMKQRPGVSVEELHKGMDCKDWDK